MIGEINDQQDVHIDWKKDKLLGALNMILGQIFSCLIPILCNLHIIHEG